ncbi:MAG TPA: sigma factor-like helix-turn-helix DNA-binding protein [Thermoanaerobaculia bacterium]|jgi:hypothetical protein
MASPAELLAAYDAYAPRLFALALRITGERDAAAAALEEVFATRGAPAELAGLIRLTREKSLNRSARRNVEPDVERPAAEPLPHELVEEAYYRGASVAELAAAYGLAESRVRELLRAGMAALRQRVAAGEEP